ncbi:hypothetical protein GGX14DRAFT_665545 [Mycena pura]|uniref:Conidiation protein 6 n=1 Tax=Mycena pura TaxID=153505 RepID=A0AAD6V6D2_9AGAR|nr:hypothetical protein GGX14DRAFT_665545 [Mycena pura]
MSTENKDPTRVAAGLKSALARPNVSDEAKERAEERLKEMNALDEPSDSHASDPTRVAAGLKSALARPDVSDEAKERAEERLKEMALDEPSDTPGHASGESKAKTATSANEGMEADGRDSVRVQAGYKAALSNPRVSEEAKQNAREYLEETTT